MKPSRLYTAFVSAAEKRSADTAFTFLDAKLEPTSYTYARLFEDAERIGSALTASVGGQRAPTGILLQSQEAQVLHYLGALSAGAVPAILTPPNRKLNRQYYAETMTAVLDRSGFAAVITDTDAQDLPTLGLEPYTLGPLNGGRRPRARSNEVPLDAPFLQFSSGTTGIKRGVVVSEDAVLAQLRDYARALEVAPEDRIVSWLPLYHDMGFIACLNMPLLHGVHSIMLDPIDWVGKPALFLQAASRYGATLAWNPNFAYAFMAQRVADTDLRDVDLSSLRALVNCSEPVTYASQQQFAGRFRPYGLPTEVFKGCYAMAETTFALTHGDAADPRYLDHTGPADGARRTENDPYVSVGRPLPGVELSVVDTDGRPVSDRRTGELLVRAPYTFSGYYNDPSASEEAFVDGWYRTGDLGYSAGDAYYVTGRRKDVLIVGGVNVFPGDIEEVAGGVAGVRPGRIAAFSRFDPRLQTERITVLAEPAEGADASETIVAVRQRILATFQVANFEVHLVPPDWLIKSSSGKMARSANREKWYAAEGRP